MSDREAKRKRVLELRDSALDLIEAYGRTEGNIDYRGQLTRIRSFAGRRLHLEYWSPRHPTDVDRGDNRPTTYMLIIKFDGAKVLHIGWDGDRLNLIRYEPGGWERMI